MENKQQNWYIASYTEEEKRNIRNKKKGVLIIDHKEIKSIARNYYHSFEEIELITNTFPIKKYQSLMSLLVNSIEHSKNRYTTHKN